MFQIKDFIIYPIYHAIEVVKQPTTIDLFCIEFICGKTVMNLLCIKHPLNHTSLAGPEANHYVMRSKLSMNVSLL